MKRIWELLNDKLWYLKTRIRMVIESEDGMGTVEVVLIIVVLVGLVLIFKNQISDIVGGIFETIQSNVESVGE